MKRELGRELVRETRELESQPGEQSKLSSSRFSFTVVVFLKAVLVVAVAILSSFPISLRLLSSNAEWRKSCLK